MGGGPGPSPTRRDLFLSTVAVVSLALAEPILNLLGGNPTFFTARAAPRIDVFLLAAVLALVIPLCIALGLAALHTVHRSTGIAAHAGVFVIAGAALTLALLNRSGVTTLSARLAFPASLLVAFGLWFAYRRTATARAMLRYLAVAPVALLAFFLFVAPAARLAWPPGAALQPVDARVKNPAPVVLIVFDEFPVASIMDGGGDLRADHFPGFAHLAANSTWFRNTAGVVQSTEYAIPTILSGVEAPMEGKVPRAADYPQTLFSLIGNTYDVAAVETVTELCPSHVCHDENRSRTGFWDRWRSLLQDLVVVYGHLVLPADLEDRLPAVDQGWGDFASPATSETSDWSIKSQMRANVAADRRVPVARLLDLVDRPLDDGDLVFAHLLFPHSGWNYLPDGRLNETATAPPARDGPRWKSEPWLVAQAYQWHLVQTQYVDSIVDDVISRLQAHASYDDALIVVLADHGISFQPGSLRRSLSQDNVAELASVPLFIKSPHQNDGVIDDYRAETIDVLPTMADLLDVDVPWATDGVSLFGSDRPVRKASTMAGPGRTFTLDAGGEEKLETVAYYDRYFGDRGPFGIAPDGYAPLLGQRLETLSVQTEPDLRVTLENPSRYAAMDPGGDPVPALMTGQIAGDVSDDSVLAVALNGEIVAVTRTWPRGDQTWFQALIPPHAFSERNEVQVLQVNGLGSDQVLMVPAGQG